MNVFNRSVLLIFALLVAVFSLLLLLLALPFIPMQYEEALRKFIFDSDVTTLFAVIMLLLSVKFIFNAMESSGKYDYHITNRTELGEIKISFDTIKSIALSSIKNINSIKEAKAQVKDNKGDISIIVNVVFATGTIIPELSKQIQNSVKEAVESATEVAIKEVIVIVEESNNYGKRRVG